MVKRTTLNTTTNRLKAGLKAIVYAILLAPLFSLIATPFIATLNVFTQEVHNPFIFTSSDSLKANPNNSRDDKKKIYLEHADSLLFDMELLPGINKLVGNVSLRHDGWLMQCDSAYLKEEDNSFEAFEHIQIQDDSITIKGQYLFYDGQRKFAQLRRTAELSNDNATLYTDSLDYDRLEGKGYYFNGGTIVDSINTLSSLYGEYVPKTNEAFFEQEVVLENPDYTLYTDRLRYNTETKIAYFDGPTIIVSDSGKIESTRGIYDTDKDVAILLDKSKILHKRGNMTGDSILYDRKQKLAEAFGRMVLNDTINKMILRGDYGYFVEDTEYAFATVYAYLEDYSREDTLYIGADTLEMISRKDTNTTKADNSIRLLLAYHRGKIYKKDMQGLADSIAYFSHDSILSLYQNPIVWSDSLQLEGDTLRAFFAGDTLHHATSWLKAKSMRQLKDSLIFDQVKCDSMIAFFADNKVRELRAFREVEMVYFPLQESINRYFGVGNLKCPKSYVYFAGDSVERAISFGPVEGALHPIEKATDTEKKLPDLQWEPQKRLAKPEEVISPLLDSLGKPLPFTPTPLVDLARFDGSLSALKAYQILDKEIALSKERVAIRTKDRIDQAKKRYEALSIYIRKANIKDKPYKEPFDIQDFIHLKWPYSFIPQNLENITTPLSITIPERMPSEDEPKRSETNLSTEESSKQQKKIS